MVAWTVPRIWPGEAAFILAGGPSVLTQDLKLLAGRHVIAINSSYLTYPAADYLFFGDMRWFREHHAGVKAFPGRAVTCSWVDNAFVYHLNRRNPPGLSKAPDTLTMRNTSLAGAINLACHLGATLLVLLGADGKPGADGRTHHHAPHKWAQTADCWQRMRGELVGIVAPLRERDVTVLNASPGSAWGDLWPVVDLSEAIALADCLKRQAAA